MRNALIGAFVLSVMMAPLAAMGGDLLINADTNTCHVLLVDGTNVEVVSGSDVKITVGLNQTAG